MRALDESATRHETACGDGVMVWREWGEGPPVVLLHGGFGSWLHWIRNIEPLTRRHRVLAGDLPGLGESSLPPRPDSPGDIGAVVAAGIEALLGDGERCDLVGFSFGGMISGHVAARLGDRVRALTLVGTSGLGVVREPMTLMRRHEGMTDAERDAAYRHNVKTLMLYHDESVDALALAIHARNDGLARLKSRRLSLGDSLRRVLPDVRARLNAIWGEHDPTAVPRIEERRVMLREMHPEVDFRLIANAGHWVQYEAAAAFNETLLEMLSREG